MAGKAGLKAGLIGAAALFVLSAISIVSYLVPGVPVDCVCCGILLLGYAGVGVLAGSFLAPPRASGNGAGAGAIAGLIAGAGSALGWIVSMGVRTLLPGAQATLDPQTLQAIRDAGMSPEIFTTLTSGPAAVAITGSVCCLASLAIGAGLGALGGLIFAAAKSD